MAAQNQITVTSPLLPNLEEYNSLLQDIWNRKWITNNGYYHQQLEQALAEYLGVPYISLFTNGTLPLITALQALGITEGEVITTPYSFVATSHSIWWNKLKPVFVDIEEDTCGMNPTKIEEAITDKTVAIMPVHCYGCPCNVQAIDAIAKKHNLKVIYDAAHAFGVQVLAQSLSYDNKDSFVCKWGAHTADAVLYGRLKEHANHNRKNPTEAESILWNMLRGNGLNLHFRRQHIIQDFIVDFFCVDKGLSIELDGGYHLSKEQQQEDARRTQELQRLGVTELRFTNEELFLQPDQVLSKIKDVASHLPSRVASHLPSLQGGAGGRLISILEYGDVSTLSFHATKVYNTIEGGAMVMHTPEMKYDVDNLKNFGFRGETTVVAPGINSKMDEMRAAYGLLNLKQVDKAIETRKHVASMYVDALKDVKGIRLFPYEITPFQNADGLSSFSLGEDRGKAHFLWNFAYFPILVTEEYGKTRDELYFHMREQGILGRRYFYPLITDFEPYKDYPSAKPENLPVANRIANQVICLPMHHALSEENVEKVLNAVAN